MNVRIALLALAASLLLATYARAQGTVYIPSAGGADEGGASPCADDEILRTNGSVWACEAAPGAGSGDDVSVDAVDVTNPNLADTARINVTDTAGNVTFDIIAGSLDATHLGTDSVSADELNAAGVESELEAVLDLQDLQGAVTDAQVPDNITVNWGTAAGSVDSDQDGTDEFVCSGVVCSVDPDDDTTVEFSFNGTSGRFLTGYLEFDESFATPTCASGDYFIYPDEGSSVLRKCQDGTVTDLDTALAGSGTVKLDLTDDDINESVALTEIAVTGDTNNVFTESAPDKLLIDAGQNWPFADGADVANQLANDPAACVAQFVRDISDEGATLCESITDADVPDTITIATAADAGCIDSDDDGTCEVSRTGTTVMIDPDDDGAAEVTIDADGDIVTTGTVTSGDPGDNLRGIELTDNTTNCADPASGNTSLCTIAGDLYIRDTGGSSTLIGANTKYERVVIESLAAADDNFPVWLAQGATTIVSARCLCVGTCTTEADIRFEDGAGNAMTGTVDCEDTTAGDTETTISGTNTLVAGEVLAIDVTNTPTTGDNYVFYFGFQGQ